MWILKDKKFYLSTLLFALIATLIIISWYRHGFLYGGGDVGLPSYNPQRILDITKYVWWEASAPGTVLPQGLTSVPLQFFQSLLQLMGLSYVVIQALVFWLVLFFMGIGMMLVGIEVFGRKKYILAVLAGIFYMFNPYMMVEIWHRFIHNAFFLAVALPYFFLLFKTWIRDGKYFALAAFLIVNSLLAYLYGTIAFSLTVLALLLFVCFVHLFLPWNGFNTSKQIVMRSFIGILTWLLINTWWLYPVIHIAPAILSSQHSENDSLSTLLSISSQTIIPYSFLGINSYYLYIQSDFGKIYDSYFFRVLPWLALIFLVPGFIIALKNKKWSMWAILAVLGLYISKGATAPFGYPYIWGFSNFFVLGVLRNPFEKTGILTAFSFSILIPIGIDWYLSKAKKKLKIFTKGLVLLVLFLILGVNLWPMWFGKIFGSFKNPAYVEVPKSYVQADEFIKNQKQAGKILHLPLTLNESIGYNWQYGYNGVEPNQLLFGSLPSISHTFNLSNIDDALTGLSYSFILPNSEDKILKLVQDFNVKFIVLHKDTEWLGGYLPDPEKLEGILNKLNFFEKKATFGDLVIYELKDEYFSSRISLTNQVDYLISAESNGYQPWLLSKNNNAFLSTLPKQSNSELVKNSQNLIASPEKVYKYFPEKISKENLLGEMPAAKVLPDSPLYLLIKFKEYAQKLMLPVNEKFSFEATLAGKRLTEAFLLKQKKAKNSIVPLIQEYEKILSNIKDSFLVKSNGREDKGEISVNFILSRHLAVLNILRDDVNGEAERQVVNDAIDQLNTLMSEADITPRYPMMENSSLSVLDRLVSKFNLPLSGKYEILLSSKQSQNLYANKLNTITFQINNTIKELKGNEEGNFISYGQVDLPEGINEISFNSLPSINLVDSAQVSMKGNVTKNNDEIDITSDKHDSSYYDIDLGAVPSGDWYQLTFDSWIKLGDKFKIQVLQDTDPYDPNSPGSKVPSYDNDFIKDQYENYWNSNTFNFYVNPTTTHVVVRLLVPPWEGCRYLQPLKERCSEKGFGYPYQLIGQSIFKNIKIIRSLTNSLFLRKDLSNPQPSSPAGNVSFTQYSPTKYSGTISAKTPGFLIFSETIHPGWVLKLSQDNKSIYPQRFISNLYGNAWYIEKSGDYNFNLEFTPENDVMVGLVVSSLCLVLIIGMAIRQRIKND